MNAAMTASLLAGTMSLTPLLADELGESTLVRAGADGRLVYRPYSERGDRLPDFSNCGYMGGGVALPDVPVRVTVMPDPAAEDDTARLQAAIDQVAALPRDERGFRGAVLMKAGEYRVAGSLTISVSGVVLRGEGNSNTGTTLHATGAQKRTLIQVRGESGRIPIDDTATAITDSYVPVGARTFGVEDASRFAVGDSVIVRRIGNAAWINAIGMDRIMPRDPDRPEATRQWQPFDLDFDRVITAIDGNQVTVDAPIVCAIDEQWGGGVVLKYTDEGRIDQVGLEHFRAICAFDATKTDMRNGQTIYVDEDHAQQISSFENVKNAWARDLEALHFNHGVTNLQRGAKWVTIQDCSSREPVSIITGGRRYPFNNSGQQNLVLRCTSEGARHAFAIGGGRTPGPNAFVDCRSENDWTDSGPHQRWSVGTLYDNVHGVLRTQDRQHYGSGHGWAGANDVYWNCEGRIVVQRPPTAENFSIGFVGRKDKPSFDEMGHPEGFTESFGLHVEPRSLYRAQLADRLGPQAANNLAPTAPLH